MEKFQFQHPCTISVIGGTGSGKTILTKNVLTHAHDMFLNCPKKLLILYNQYQPAYDELRRLKNFSLIEIVQGLNVDFNDFSDSIIYLDDMMTEIMQNKKLQEVFIRLSHHKSISVIMSLQNIFLSGRFSRDIRLNVQYYILMKSFAMSSQVQSLSTQIFPHMTGFLADAYKKATVKAFGYLVIILHPQWDDLYRVLSNIFPGECLRVFVENTP